MKKGRAIIGFDIHWSTGKFKTTASKDLITEIRAIIGAINSDASKLIMSKVEELTELTTQDQAQNIYDYIKIRMNELNQILIDTQTENDEKSIFYD